MPVLVDGDGAVIAGHGRVLAAQALGMAEVPTIRVEHLSPAQRQAYLIADNRLTENSRWDDRLLAEQLQALAALDLDFALEVTGFEMAEIDLRIEGLQTAITPPVDPDDHIYVAVTGETKARELERYFKSGSGKAFAKKRFLRQ